MKTPFERSHLYYQARSLSCNNSTTNTLTTETISLDKEIDELHRKYCVSKYQRKVSENEYKLLSNKVKLLRNEESKILKKQRSDISFHEKQMNVYNDKVKNKELILKSKLKITQKLKELKTHNDVTKNERDVNLKQWRDINIKNKKDVINKIKYERKKEYECYLKRKCNELLIKKENVNEIHKQRARSIECRIKGEYNKRMLLKKELLRKIMEEDAQKEKYEKELTKCEEQSTEIINRMKLYNDNG